MRSRTLLAAHTSPVAPLQAEDVAAHGRALAELGKRIQAWAGANPGARQFPPSLAADASALLAERERIEQGAAALGITFPPHLDDTASIKAIRAWIGSGASN
jgi:hypothetical protein